MKPTRPGSIRIIDAKEGLQSAGFCWQEGAAQDRAVGVLLIIGCAAMAYLWFPVVWLPFGNFIVPIAGNAVAFSTVAVVTLIVEAILLYGVWRGFKMFTNPRYKLGAVIFHRDNSIEFPFGTGGNEFAWTLVDSVIGTIEAGDAPSGSYVNIFFTDGNRKLLTNGKSHGMARIIVVQLNQALQEIRAAGKVTAPAPAAQFTEIN